jgi:hypothetical protein
MKTTPLAFLVSGRLITAAITSMLLTGAYAKPLTPINTKDTGAKAASLSSSAAKLKGVPAVWPPVDEKRYAGARLEPGYASELKSLKEVINRALPKVGGKAVADFEKVGNVAAEAEAKAEAAQKELAQIGAAKGLIDHAKGKWIGGANKNIAAAQAALKNAKTSAEKEAAKNQLAAAQKNLAEGEAALKERTALYEQAKAKEPALKRANEEAQAVLAQAKTRETSTAKGLMGSMGSFLTSDALDGKLAKAYILTSATPKGLAEFGEQSSEKAALVKQLLANEVLMKDMVEAGGASFGKFGQAMEIFSTIQKISPQAKEGVFYRLALATSLEHAKPIGQSNCANIPNQDSNVNPVKRYLHYETAYLNGELDPAFKSLTAWEMRHVVNCDAPDEVLSWGREMLRTYRPDYMLGDYGWRYVSSVKGEVPYGSQNVQYDDPANHKYQNIIRNGGVCGRRAFFGRFILRSFGIPTWGVTQKAHAALSHWTPKGWVVNLGAAYQFSWWDKDDVSLSGTQFLLETKARAHEKEYKQVLRAEMVSCILGEPAYNERRNVEGGFWSNVALQQARTLAASAADLGALGQELGEANEKDQKLHSEAADKADREVLEKDGRITVPAVAHDNATGKVATMRSFDGGMQIHAFGGFKTEYKIRAPRTGDYLLSVKVATAQTGQKFLLSANGGETVEQPVPYTIGVWKNSDGIPVKLKNGMNTLQVEISPGSRGVTIKSFTFTPKK